MHEKNVGTGFLGSRVFLTMYVNLNYFIVIVHPKLIGNFKRTHMLTLSCLVWSGGLFVAKPAVDGQFPPATDPEG